MKVNNKHHVVKITSSGLGDAIKAALVGALYSEVSGRLLVVDWRKSRYSNRGENTFYSLFNLQNIKTSREIPTDQNIRPKSWNTRLQMSLDEVYTEDGWSIWNRQETIATYSIDFSKIDYSESITVSWDFDQISKLLPYFSDFSTTSELLRHAANKYLQINSELEPAITKILGQLPEKYLGVHIRATKEFEENKGG
jgi:hypothetical protein